MASVVIVGAQWGDEGKGKIVDKLAGEANVVVRFQGGDNAGHTVYHAGRKYVFHILPSGMLHSRVLNLIGGGVVVNLEKLVKELKVLHLSPSVWRKRLRISGEASLILPCHIAMDEMNEQRMGKGKIGTTLRGIGPAYADRAARIGVRFEDIFNKKILRERLQVCFNAKRGLLSKKQMLKECNLNQSVVSLQKMAKIFYDDRKHQQEEMLKQVPSVKKIDDMVKNHFGLLINKVPRGLFAKAIHDLIERKLEKRCGNCAYADEGYCYLHNSEIGEDGVCENWKEVPKEKESEN